MAEPKDRVTRFSLNVKVLKLGGGYVAVCDLAGVQFRGNRKDTPFAAARDVFLQLTQEQNLDANLALDLASSGEDYSSIAEAQAADDAAVRAIEGQRTTAFGQVIPAGMCGAVFYDDENGDALCDRVVGHPGPHTRPGVA